MKKRILCHFAVLLFLLSLCACRAALPGESDTAAPTSEPTETSATPPTATLAAQIEVWREGERSLIPVQIVSGQCGSYTIAMDPAYFSFLPQKDGDLFSYEAWGSAQPVYYRVSPYRGPYDPDAFIRQCKQPQFRQTGTEALTLGGYPATLVTMEGTEENTGYCLHRYLVNCGEARYCIEARFSMEMYEGLYAIMRACFDTFTAF